MTAYRRAFHPGGCYFFTLVTEHRRPLLIDNIHRLRRAFRMGIDRRPLQIDAIVVLPDHLHTLWRLPEGDSDFSTRWMHIKRCFSADLQAQGVSASQRRKREEGVWQHRLGMKGTIGTLCSGQATTPMPPAHRARSRLEFFQAPA